jgi:hypothetical protein
VPTQKEIVQIINDVLETTWTEFEVTNGKVVDVPPTWRGQLKPIIKEYRKVGWTVTRNVEICSTSPGNPRDYMTFVNPTWMMCPEELRDTIPF